MRWLNVVLLVFAVMNVLLGIEAYTRVHSVMSIMGGGGAGVILVASVALAKTSPRAGRTLSLAVCLFLMGFFLPQFFSGKPFFPAGLIGLTSLAVAFCLLGAHFYATMLRRKTA